MTLINETVRILSGRLPELAWKLGPLNTVLNYKLLPRGLFTYQFEMTPQSCINEIYADLKTIEAQKNERSAHYLAERVHQKINVLVRLCQMRAKKKSHLPAVSSGIHEISTRQQWLHTLQDQITGLNEQRQALIEALNKLQSLRQTSSILSLQSELGELEQRLTLMRETHARAIS